MWGSKLNKRTLGISIISILLLILFSLFGAVYLFGQNDSKAIRVACVGDSLTQSTEYVYDLMHSLSDNYEVRKFGVGSTTVTLVSETPYMATATFQNALVFEPDIVIIMLGTNDAQPSLFPYNTTFVDDYKTLIGAFQNLPSNPKIWLVLPPPIFSNQSDRISPEYFEQTVLPNIKQVAKETNLPIIDVYSLLIDYPEYFPDGIHPPSSMDNFGDEPVAQIIAAAVRKAITSQKM